MCEDAPRTPSPLEEEVNCCNEPKPTVSSAAASEHTDSISVGSRRSGARGTHRIVDMGLAKDICFNSHRGISVPTSLKLASGLRSNDYSSPLSEIKGWSVVKGPEYKKLKTAFYDAEEEKHLYNIILDCRERMMTMSRSVHLQDTTRAKMEEGHLIGHRIGTAPFMAREALDSTRSYEPKIYHDLESLFYCIVWRAVGYRKNQSPPKGDPLKLWRKASLETMYKEKRMFIEKRETRSEACNDADPYLRRFVLGIWMEYNVAWSDHKESRDCKRIQSAAKKARDEALARGLSVAGASKVYRNRLAVLDAANRRRDPTIMKGLGITYATWMRATGRRMNISGCDCCK